MPCLRFNEAINVSFVEFGEVSKSSCKFEFLTLLEPAVILSGGNKTMTHIDFCKSPFSRSIPDTQHIGPCKHRRFEDNTQFYKAEECSSWTERQRNPKNLARPPEHKQAHLGIRWLRDLLRCLFDIPAIPCSPK